MWSKNNRHSQRCECVFQSVYLLSEQSSGQKATAVAELPTSKIEEHGLMSAGGAISSEPSRLQGPHTITCRCTKIEQSAAIHLHCSISSKSDRLVMFIEKNAALEGYPLVSTWCHKVFAVWAPVTWPDDSRVHGCLLSCVCIHWEGRLCRNIKKLGFFKH